MPVFTSRADIPKFALTDNDGGILSFVSPRSGLNIRPYLRKQVGVLGQRAYLSNLKKPHLSITRIVVLDRHVEQAVIGTGSVRR